MILSLFVSTLLQAPLQADAKSLVRWEFKAQESQIKTVVPAATSHSLNGARAFECSDKNRAPCRKGATAQNDCTRRAERCDCDLFEGKLDGPWIPCCEKRSLFEMLQWFDNLVAPHVNRGGEGFWYSIIYGTAIAAVRDQALIDWDTDIDIAVPKEKKSWLLNLIRDKVHTVDPPYHIGDDGDIMRLHLSEKNLVHIDVWLVDNTTHGGMCPQLQEVTWLPGQYFPLSDCTLHGSQFPCFLDTTRHLDYLYKKDWRHKAKDKSDNGDEAELPRECRSSDKGDDFLERQESALKALRKDDFIILEH